MKAFHVTVQFLLLVASIVTGYLAVCHAGHFNISFGFESILAALILIARK